MFYREVIYVTLLAEQVIINDIHSMSREKGPPREDSQGSTHEQFTRGETDELQHRIDELTNRIRELQYAIRTNYGKMQYDQFMEMVREEAKLRAENIKAFEQLSALKDEGRNDLEQTNPNTQELEQPANVYEGPMSR